MKNPIRIEKTPPKRKDKSPGPKQLPPRPSNAKVKSHAPAKGKEDGQIKSSIGQNL
jgi:hypothetical protein